MPYTTICGVRTILPIQPSIGQMYLLWNASGFQVLDGKRIGFLKEMVMEREKDPVSESAAGKSGIR